MTGGGLTEELEQIQLSYWTSKRPEHSILKIESNRAAWLAVLSETQDITVDGDRWETGTAGEELRCAEQQITGSSPGRGKDGQNKIQVDKK